MDVTSKVTTDRGNLELSKEVSIRLENNGENGLHVFLKCGEDIRGPIRLRRVTKSVKRAERFYPDLLPRIQEYKVGKDDVVESVYFTIPRCLKFSNFIAIVIRIKKPSGKVIRFRGTAWQEEAQFWKRFISLYWLKPTKAEADHPLRIALRNDLVDLRI